MKLNIWFLWFHRVWTENGLIFFCELFLPKPWFLWQEDEGSTRDDRKRDKYRQVRGKWDGQYDWSRFQEINEPMYSLIRGPNYSGKYSVHRDRTEAANWKPEILYRLHTDSSPTMIGNKVFLEKIFFEWTMACYCQASTWRFRYSKGWLRAPSSNGSWPWRWHRARLSRWRWRSDIRDRLSNRQATRLGLLAAAIKVAFDAAEAEEGAEEFRGGGMQAGNEQARKLRRLASHPRAEGRPPLDPAPSSGSSNSNWVID